MDNRNNIFGDQESLFGDDDDFLFDENEDLFGNAKEKTESSSKTDVLSKNEQKNGWKILVVDDEKDVHHITHLSLEQFVFQQKPLNLIDAYSATEARKILQTDSNIALILLDVVMETTHAGLDLTKYIRDELKNKYVRIILRTGQPGEAPERYIIQHYDINDYQNKAELTQNKLYTVITAGLRTFTALKEIENYSRNLEQMVKDRTHTIEEQQKLITQSIQYASRIQCALLPSAEFIQEIFPQHFIFFRPRDIVSGDFYWATGVHDTALIAAADCTGHGVPGAFMSMLGIAFLNEIVSKETNIQPHEILNHLRENIIIALKQRKSQSRDGMDIALCAINKQNMTITFAGAQNPIYIITKDIENKPQLIEYEGDNMPIGIHKKADKSFTSHIIPIKAGDIFYIFSDGFADQFGGEMGIKYMSRRFKNLLLTNHHKPLDEQKNILEQTLIEWIGNEYEQIDDILIIGVMI